MKTSKTQKTIKLPFTFNFKWPSKDKFSKPTLKATTILVNGKLVTCIILSIVSAFIDLVFFSGLSKSFYELFGIIAIPAGLLMSIMSIGFSLGKFFCAMQLGAIEELKTRLKSFGYTWYKNLNKLSWKWHVIHKFLIGVSILTSISLSVVSIGTGVTRNATKLKQLDELIIEGTKYNDIVNTAKDTSLKATVSKSVDTSEADALKYTTEQMARIRPAVEEYKRDREAFNLAGLNVNSTEPNEIYSPNPSVYWDRRRDSVNNLLQNAGYATQSGQGIYNLNLATVESTIKNQYLENNRPKNADVVKKEMEEARESTLEEARGWLETLNSLNFTRNEQSIGEKGKIVYTSVPVVFDTDQNTDTKVLVTRALSLLKQYRTDVESDSGDIGASSKLFMMVGNAWDKAHSKKSETVIDALNTDVKTGMGSTEIMIMVVIMLFGVVQEFLIALFTPKSTISRKMLYQFDSYFDMKEFDINQFLLVMYRDYYNKGIISKDDFEAKAKKCVELMDDTIDDIKKRYSKKTIYEDKLAKAESQLSEKNKEIEELSNRIKSFEIIEKKVEPYKKDELSVINITDTSRKERVIAPKVTSVKENVKINNTSETAHFSTKVDDLVNEIEGIE